MKTDTSIPSTEDHLSAYIAFLEGFSRDQLDGLAQVYSPGVRFKDPFNDTTGLISLRAIYEDMFEQISDLEFAVTASAAHKNGGFIRWTLKGHLRAHQWSVEGMSDITFDSDGLVTAHIDYWDAASSLYEKLPVIGPLARWLRRRIAVS